MEWFEKIGFDNNPFANPRELVSVDEIIKEAEYYIFSGGIVFVEGDYGTGKTAILNKFVKKFGGRGKVLYIDCKKIGDSLDVSRAVMKKGVFGKMFGKEPKNILLLMDNVSVLSMKNLERLKYLYDNNTIKSMIMTGKSMGDADFSKSFIERIYQVIKLKPLSEDEIIEAVNKKLEGKETIPEEVIKYIFKLSRKNTKDFMVNCAKICEYVIDKKKGNVVSKEDVDYVIKGVSPKEEEPLIDQVEEEIKKIVEEKPAKKKVKKKTGKKKVVKKVKKKTGKKDEVKKVKINPDFRPSKKKEEEVYY